MNMLVKTDEAYADKRLVAKQGSHNEKTASAQGTGSDSLDSFGTPETSDSSGHSTELQTNIIPEWKGFTNTARCCHCSEQWLCRNDQRDLGKGSWYSWTKIANIFKMNNCWMTSWVPGIWNMKISTGNIRGHHCEEISQNGCEKQGAKQIWGAQQMREICKPMPYFRKILALKEPNSKHDGENKELDHHWWDEVIGILLHVLVEHIPAKASRQTCAFQLWMACHLTNLETNCACSFKRVRCVSA